ncbi:hypothetical protein H6P81_011500 [Aristolochia fimbriata]|uniref:Uncharacterized protein n=1 Tax=Aristolochia fimbriata TaxID=158543 RepID=A0AAV7ERN3_ARIFI|nr:hypothetical protein H6P81_011500 [Aristolochia fimbriata]
MTRGKEEANKNDGVLISGIEGSEEGSRSFAPLVIVTWFLISSFNSGDRVLVRTLELESGELEVCWTETGPDSLHLFPQFTLYQDVKRGSGDTITRPYVPPEKMGTDQYNIYYVVDNTRVVRLSCPNMILGFMEVYMLVERCKDGRYVIGLLNECLAYGGIGMVA